MSKNIYDKKNKYYCDGCFKTIEYGEILRNEKAIKFDKFNLCSDCKKYELKWDDVEDENE